jgi:nitric oxide reductase NorQ protein
MSKATYKQTWTLFKFTSRDWRTVEIDIESATKIVGLCIGFFIKKDCPKEDLETAVQAYFPDWTVKDRKFFSKKKSNESSETVPEVAEEKKEKPERKETKSEWWNKEQSKTEEKEKEQPAQVPSESPVPFPETTKDPEPVPDKPKQKKTSPKSNNGYFAPAIYEQAKNTVDLGINLLISGPAGCGKSRMVEEISKELSLEFFTISFAGGLRYAQVFGSTHLENGNSRWVPGPLIEAIQKPGLINLDEIFSADPDVLLGLNAILETNSRSILTPMGKINVHPDCKFVACANTIGRSSSRQYTGAQRTDDSLLDRFVTLAMDYDPILEKSIIKEHSNGATDTLIAKIARFRMTLKENNIQFDASTRRLIAAAKLCGAGFEVNSAWDMAFMNNLSENERAKVTA